MNSFAYRPGTTRSRLSHLQDSHKRPEVVSCQEVHFLFLDLLDLLYQDLAEVLLVLFSVAVWFYLVRQLDFCDNVTSPLPSLQAMCLYPNERCLDQSISCDELQEATGGLDMTSTERNNCSFRE